MKRQWVGVVIHLIFWAVTGWLIISGFSIQQREIEVINGTESIRTIRNESMVLKLSLCVVLSCILFYLNLLNISRLTGKDNRKKVLITSGVLIAGCLGAYLLIGAVVFDRMSLSLPVSLVTGVFCFYFAISVAYGFGRVWLRSEQRSQALALAQKQAELTLLRNQLQPHFLFNALNNLLSLVDQEKSPLLATSIDRLSGLLRHVVYETASGMVTVHQEVEFIRNYGELQLLRFAPGELDFRFSVTGTFDTQMIEPGICIPFVENAFKYGAEPETQSLVTALVSVPEPGRMTFTIENKVYPALQQHAGSRKGIATTMERLRLVYPGRHTLKITENGIYRVELTLITDESSHR